MKSTIPSEMRRPRLYSRTFYGWCAVAPASVVVGELFSWVHSGSVDWGRVAGAVAMLALVMAVEIEASR